HGEFNIVLARCHKCHTWFERDQVLWEMSRRACVDCHDMRRRDFIGVLSRSARMWALRILRKHSAQPNRIPKKLHIIWVGDEAQCPSHCIQSWKDKHPDWEVRVWG